MFGLIDDVITDILHMGIRGDVAVWIALLILTVTLGLLITTGSQQILARVRAPSLLLSLLLVIEAKFIQLINQIVGLLDIDVLKLSVIAARHYFIIIRELKQFILQL